jgi:hypothetical protein
VRICTVAEAAALALRRSRPTTIVVAGTVTHAKPSVVVGAHLPHRVASCPDDAVLVRVDVEDDPSMRSSMQRPFVERADRGIDFSIADETGRLHVCVTDGEDGARVSSDFDAFLDATPALSRTKRGLHVRLRAVRPGERVWVKGIVEPLDEASAGYREGGSSVLIAKALWDEPAWRQLDAWRSLPWYRKLSVMFLNR